MHLESIDSAWHLPHLVMFTSQYFIHDINHEKKISCICDIAVFFFMSYGTGGNFWELCTDCILQLNNQLCNVQIYSWPHQKENRK